LRSRVFSHSFSSAGKLPHRSIRLVDWEFAARHARRYAAIAGFSGGLIGPAGTPRDYTGSFDGTPVFLGCSDVDPHIPLQRVHESAEVFRRMGARVEERIHPRMGHTINPDELESVDALFSKILR